MTAASGPEHRFLNVRCSIANGGIADMANLQVHGISCFDDREEAQQFAQDCLRHFHQRWSHFVRQPVKVDSPIQRTNHHEDAETVFG